MAAPATETPNMDHQVDLSTIPISPNGKSEGAEAKDGDKPVTVFHDKDNFNVKHPLQNKWTLWFTKPPSGKVRFLIMFYSFEDERTIRILTGTSQGDNWNDLLKEVITFDSVEEFWGVYVRAHPK